MLDAENRGYIDAVKLQLICRKLGEDLSVEEVRPLPSHSHLLSPLILQLLWCCLPLLPLLRSPSPPRLNACCSRLLFLTAAALPSAPTSPAPRQPSPAQHQPPQVYSLSRPPCLATLTPPLAAPRVVQTNDMVNEALIGFNGEIFYDGLLKILITQ